MDFLILFVAGLAIGVVASFFGIGGGVIIIPTLAGLYPQMPYQMVIGSALALIFLGTVLHQRTFIKSGRKPDYKIALTMALALGISTYFAGEVAMNLPKDTLKKIFGVILILVVIRTLFFKARSHSEESWNANLKETPWVKSIIIGLVGGVVSGLTGLGGGAVLVPLMMTSMKMPLKWISVYSQTAMMGIIVGLISFVTKEAYGEIPFKQFVTGQVNWALVFVLFAGTFVTSGVGVKFNNLVSDKTKKYSFAALFLFVAIRIFVKS